MGPISTFFAYMVIFAYTLHIMDAGMFGVWIFVVFL